MIQENIKNNEKKCIISEDADLLHVSIIQHIVWNMGNTSKLFNNLNDLVENENILLEPESENKDIKIYNLIFNSIYRNMYSISKKDNYYALLYLPLTPNEFDIYCAENNDILNNYDINLFIKQYNYIEDSLIQTLISKFKFFDFLVTNEKQSFSSTPTSEQIESLRFDILQQKNASYDILSADFLNSDLFNEEFYHDMTEEYKFILFFLAYSTLNYKLLENLLKYDNGSMYEIISTKNPESFLWISDYQELTIYLNNIMTQHNYLSLLKIYPHLQPNFTAILFFNTVRLYNNFVLFLRKVFSKIEFALNKNKSVIQLDLYKKRELKPLDNFEILINIENISHN